MNASTKLKVLYFATAREAVGKQSETISVAKRVTVAEVLGHLVVAHPMLLPLKGSIRISVNQEIVEDGAALKDGDEVGVLPPVAGG